jgi:glycosyltransferase involved in cell wall biosynthesis
VLPVVRQGKRAPGVKRAVFIHHIVQDMPRPKNLNTFLANIQEQRCFELIKQHFDYIITVNQDVVTGLRSRGFTQPILCSSNFVNPHTASPVPLAQKDITMAFCGRLVNQKGIQDFIATARTLQAERDDFSAVMIGVGPEYDWLDKTIKDANLHVTLAGRVDDAQKFDLLSRSKLFVFPSVEEGWGIAIAEALSVGTPVVAYDLPVYREPFGAAVQSVPLKNTASLTERVRMLLADYDTNPAAYAAAQQQAVQQAATFSRDRVAATEYDFLTGKEQPHD